jgi:peroxiredoxin Q/BCP
MRFSRLTFVAMLFLLASSVTCTTVAEGVQVGEAAPEFSLPGSDGSQYSLEQFKGKTPVVIAWFPKAFTGG